jgi:amino acid transporter
VSARDDRFFTSRSPVEGLRRRKLAFLPVFAQAVAAVAPAGAMSVIPALVFPGLVFGATGPNLVLTFGAAMAVMILVSFCLRPMTKRMAAVSGLYSYTAKGLGQKTAITAGWSALFGYGLVAMASLLVVATYVIELVTNLGVLLSDPKVFAVLVVLAAAGSAGFLMVRGIRVSAWFTVLMESLSIGVLAVLMIVYFAFTAPTTVNLEGVFAWKGNFDSFWIGLVVAVSAFVGFESPTTLGGEARKPFVSVPRAITWTPILAGALYLLAATAQDIALKEAPSTITASTTPLSDLFSQASPVFAAVLDLGIAASWFACAIASMNALARVLFCMGREGVAPRIFGQAHPVFQTPSTAFVVVIPLVAVVPIAAIISDADPQRALVNLFTLAAYGYLGSYILASASLPFFLRRIGEDSYASWILGAATALVLGALLWTAAIVSLRAGNWQALIYGGVLLISAIYAMILHLWLPERLASVGIYDETRELDLFRGGPLT